jgi:hypothetical protein
MEKINPVQTPQIDTLQPLYSLDPSFRQDPSYTLPQPTTFDHLTPLKPQICHPDSFKVPQVSISLAISKFLDRVEGILAIYFEMLEKELTHSENMTASSIEKQIHLQKQLEKASEKSDWWDFLTKIAVSFLSAASIVLGATLLVPGASVLAIVAGTSMILSGGFSILGTVLSDMKSHPQLSTALMVAGSGFAIIGGISGAILGTAQLMPFLGKVAMAGLSIVSNGTTIMRESYEYELCDMKSQNVETHKANEISNESYRRLQEDLTKFGESVTRLKEECVVAAIQHEAATSKITANSGPLTAA